MNLQNINLDFTISSTLWDTITDTFKPLKNEKINVQIERTFGNKIHVNFIAHDNIGFQQYSLILDEESDNAKIKDEKYIKMNTINLKDTTLPIRFSFDFMPIRKEKLGYTIIEINHHHISIKRSSNQMTTTPIQSFQNEIIRIEHMIYDNYRLVNDHINVKVQKKRLKQLIDATQSAVIDLHILPFHDDSNFIFSKEAGQIAPNVSTLGGTVTISKNKNDVFHLPPQRVFAEIKQEIIKFINREYDENNNPLDFDKIYPDISENISLAYKETPDEKYKITYEINLITHKGYLFVNNNILETTDFRNDFLRNEPLGNILMFLKETNYDSMLYIDEDLLKEKLNLEIDDSGNFV